MRHPSLADGWTRARHTSRAPTASKRRDGPVPRVPQDPPEPGDQHARRLLRASRITGSWTGLAQQGLVQWLEPPVEPLRRSRRSPGRCAAGPWHRRGVVDPRARIGMIQGHSWRDCSRSWGSSAMSARTSVRTHPAVGPMLGLAEPLGVEGVADPMIATRRAAAAEAPASGGRTQRGPDRSGLAAGRDRLVGQPALDVVGQGPGRA